MRIKAILFDLDGTLLDSLWAHRESFREVFRKRGKKAPAMPLSRLIVMNYDQIYHEHRVNQTLGLTKNAFVRERLHNLESMLTKNMEILDRVRLVRRLRKKFRLALTTNSSRRIAERETSASFRRLFDAIVTGSETKRTKPAPDMLKLAARKLRVKPSKCIMIGDAVVDIQAARAANMKSIVFSGKTSASPKNQLQKERPFAIVKNANELENALKKLGVTA